MVAVVTNSVCDLSPELAEEYGVLMIPDVIIFSESEQFRNNLEIDPPTLFARLPRCEKLPTTAHPNLQLNMDTFRRAAEYADENSSTSRIVVGTEISSALKKPEAKATPAAQRNGNANFGRNIKISRARA